MRLGILRPFLHAATAALALPLMLSWDLPSWWLTAAAAAAFALDALRRRVEAVHRRVAVLVPVFRPDEARRTSGAAWLMVGYALVSWFPDRAALAGLLGGALMDPAAALAGSRLASPTRKTWVGSLAALLVGWVLLLALGLSLAQAGIPAVAGAAAERWPGPFNDNLTLPLAVGLAAWALGVK